MRAIPSLPSTRVRLPVYSLHILSQHHFTRIIHFSSSSSSSSSSTSSPLSQLQTQLTPPNPIRSWCCAVPPVSISLPWYHAIIFGSLWSLSLVSRPRFLPQLLRSAPTSLLATSPPARYRCFPRRPCVNVGRKRPYCPGHAPVACETARSLANAMLLGNGVRWLGNVACGLGNFWTFRWSCY